MSQNYLISGKFKRSIAKIFIIPNFSGEVILIWNSEKETRNVSISLGTSPNLEGYPAFRSVHVDGQQYQGSDCHPIVGTGEATASSKTCSFLDASWQERHWAAGACPKKRN